MPELANLEEALRKEFEHTPYTFSGIREPSVQLGQAVAAAYFEAPARDERGRWVAFRSFLPYELEIAADDPSFLAEYVREEIDAYYNRDFN